MNHTQHSPIAPAEANTDYQQIFRVKASPDAVFDALTGVAGLAAWWTQVTGSGDTGGELAFYFGSPEPCVIQVEEASYPTAVHWRVTDCAFLPDWVGTRPRFTITDVGGNSSEIQFRHLGLTPALDCIEMCTNGWNHSLASLRQFLEIGHGNPYGSEGDRARRLAESAASGSRSPH